MANQPAGGLDRGDAVGSGTANTVLFGSGNTEVIRLNGQTGIIDFRATMGDSTQDPTLTARIDWIEAKIAGVSRYIPVYPA